MTFASHFMALHYHWLIHVSDLFTSSDWWYLMLIIELPFVVGDINVLLPSYVPLVSIVLIRIKLRKLIVDDELRQIDWLWLRWKSEDHWQACVVFILPWSIHVQNPFHEYTFQFPGCILQSAGGLVRWKLRGALRDSFHEPVTWLVESFHVAWVDSRKEACTWMGQGWDYGSCSWFGLSILWYFDDLLDREKSLLIFWYWLR